MQTSAQMLQRGSDAAKQQHAQPISGRDRAAPGTATFTGKTDRNVSGAKRHVYQHESAGGRSRMEQPQGFFSAPITESDSADSPFCNDARRASEGHGAPKQAERPEISKEDSSTTVGGRVGIRNDSAEGPGSGLPDTDRAPVGVPQEKPTGVNYRDFGGPNKPTAEYQSFATAREPRNRPSKPMTSTARPPTQEEHPASRQTEIKEPQPRTVGKGGLSGLASPPSESSTARRRSTSNAIESENGGEPSVIQDFSGIVRLVEPGSLSGSISAAHSQGSKGASMSASGPTGVRLAQQQRQILKASSDTRDSVRNFVIQQSQTQNLSDPNAPTPLPAPSAAEQAQALELGKLGQGEGLGIKTEMGQEREGQEWEESENSLSVKDSSEMATASVDELGEADENGEIVTFRFEHAHTTDGHHVVVGREGKLQTCEEEPITTPGAVQGFGVLVVLDNDFDSGMLLVRQVSEVCNGLCR